MFLFWTLGVQKRYMEVPFLITFRDRYGGIRESVCERQNSQTGESSESEWGMLPERSETDTCTSFFFAIITLNWILVVWYNASIKKKSDSPGSLWVWVPPLRFGTTICHLKCEKSGFRSTYTQRFVKIGELSSEFPLFANSQYRFRYRMGSSHTHRGWPLFRNHKNGLPQKKKNRNWACFKCSPNGMGKKHEGGWEGWVELNLEDGWNCNRRKKKQRTHAESVVREREIESSSIILTGLVATHSSLAYLFFCCS